jgi:hypothetical protein
MIQHHQIVSWPNMLYGNMSYNLHVLRLGSPLRLAEQLLDGQPYNMGLAEVALWVGSFRYASTALRIDRH